MVNSSIQWTENTVNFWSGCKKVSEGCKFCYMARIKDKKGIDHTKVVRAHDTHFKSAMKWKDPKLIFTCSMSDFFIEDADPWRPEAWEIIRQTPQHYWQILTKRPERILDHLPENWGDGWPNVWLGVSIENQKNMDRASLLASVPCKTRFISFEPLIGPIDLKLDNHGKAVLEKIHWIIIGGESGDEEGKYKYRKCREEWMERLIYQAKETQIKIFVKQMGTALGKELGMKNHGSEFEKFPEKLKIREFPNNINSNNVLNFANLDPQSPEDKTPSYIHTAEEILNLNVTSIPLLLDPILQKEGIASLCGSSDAGKSFLGLDLAIAICTGSNEIFGFVINKQHNSAIIVCTEDSKEEICVRLKALLQGRMLYTKSLRFIFDTGTLISKLNSELDRQPADLILIDTFGDLFDGNLNQSIDIRQFLKPYKQLARNHKCLVLFNHHIGKGKENNLTPSKNDVLGSQGIESACRSVLMLKKVEEGKRILTVVKGNNIPDEIKNQGIVLDFNPNKGFTATGEKKNFLQSEKEKQDAEEELEKEVISHYPLFGSYRATAVALKEKGFKIEKNKVGIIVKKHGILVDKKRPSVIKSGKKKDGQNRKVA